MLKRKQPPFRTLWDTVSEPRWVTAGFVVVYLTLIGIGAVIFRNPHGYISGVSSITTGLLLIAAGMVGAPAAWRGAHSVEMGAGWLWIAGIASGFVTLLDVHENPGLRIPIITFLAFVILLQVGLIRMVLVSGYSKLKRPEMTSVEEIIREDREQLAESKRKAQRLIDDYDA